MNISQHVRQQVQQAATPGGIGAKPTVDKRPAKLYVALPCYGNMMSAGTALSLMSFQRVAAERGLDFVVDVLGNDSMVTHARNRLTHRFLKSDCTHLLFLDADIVLKNPADILRMLDADKSIIGAIYSRKEINWSSVRRALALDPNIPDAVLAELAGSLVCRLHPAAESFAPNEPTKALELGAGCLLIRREVFDKLRKSPHIEEAFDPPEQERVTKFWRTGTNGEGVEVGEDLFFLYAARLLGIDAYALPDVALGHVGTYEFKGSLPLLGMIEAAYSRAKKCPAQGQPGE